MIRFAYPYLLWLLILVPAWGALIWWAFRRRRLDASMFVSQKLLDRIAYSLSRRRARWKAAIWLAAWAFFVIGAADPQVGTKTEEVKREGIDVVIAVDVSNSMLCEDIAPSRLESAKQEIQRFINGLTGDRVGLVAFAGSAVLHCPLTTDYGAAKLLTRVLDSDLVTEQGTALAWAIDAAHKAFTDEGGGSRVIVIISDGEDQEEGAVDAAREAAKDGITIYTIGMGSPQGAPIPVANTKTGTSEYKRDKDGNIVVTRLNEVLLRQIADAGSGEYYRASQSGTELQGIWDEISKMQKRELGRKQYTAFEDRFQYLVLPGLLLLLAEFFLGDRRNSWRTAIRLPGVIRRRLTKEAVK